MGERKGSLWGELQRRHVVRAAAGYAAAAFVLLQLGEILFPAFGLSEAAMRALVAVLIAAFPVLMALAWVFDVRQGALHRTAPAPDASGGEAGSHGPGHPAPSAAMVGGILFLAGALGFAGLYAVMNVQAPDAAAPETAAREAGASIAVLPFADMSEEGDQGWLGDGIAEEILNILAGVDGLRVAARTSSFAFRESDQDVRQIGADLGVTTLLEGSVRREGRRMRVTAQLIDTESGFHLWSANFDRDVDDLFAVQDEIAGAIAAELVGRLDVPIGALARHEPPREAVDAYWRGRAEWGRRGVAGIPTAITFFSEAVALDSLYAEAYAGLADSYALLPQVAIGTDADEALERAEGFARTAIALNDGLAEPYASLGLVRAFRGDRAGALEALGMAIQRNPSYAPAFHWRANVLADLGQLAPALVDARHAATLDPLSVPIAADLGYLLLWTGDVAGAADEFARAVRMDFGFAKAHFGQALVALQQGEPVTLHMSVTQWTAISGLPLTMAADLAGGMLTYRSTGTPAPSPPDLAPLVEGHQLSAGTAASLAALLGARDDAITFLRQAVEDRSWVDLYLGVNTIYDPLRGDAAFQDVVEQIATG